MKHLNSLWTNTKENLVEYYTLALLVLGLPAVAWVYFDWRAALATFVLVNVTLGMLIVWRDR